NRKFVRPLSHARNATCNSKKPNLQRQDDEDERRKARLRDTSAHPEPASTTAQQCAAAPTQPAPKQANPLPTQSQPSSGTDDRDKRIKYLEIVAELLRRDLMDAGRPTHNVWAEQLILMDSERLLAQRRAYETEHLAPSQAELDPYGDDGDDDDYDFRNHAAPFLITAKTHYGHLWRILLRSSKLGATFANGPRLSRLAPLPVVSLFSLILTPHIYNHRCLPDALLSVPCANFNVTHAHFPDNQVRVSTFDNAQEQFYFDGYGTGNGFDWDFAHENFVANLQASEMDPGWAVFPGTSYYTPTSLFFEAGGLFLLYELDPSVLRVYSDLALNEIIPLLRHNSIHTISKQLKQPNPPKMPHRNHRVPADLLQALSVHAYTVRTLYRHRGGSKRSLAQAGVTAEGLGAYVGGIGEAKGGEERG
ncbi:hypothetical protein BC629DRAFT_1447146, partial [Irpex lacteus]